VKGSAGTMGAPKVRAVAAQLESAGRVGKSDLPPAELLVQLKETYEASVAALEAFLASKRQ
jgi:HPt (histidine-containing phosphotransfer) domain-containing protein